MSRFAATVATLVILLAITGIASAAPFQNGSFETINCGAGTNWEAFLAGSTCITGWTVVNQSYVTPYPETNGVVRGLKDTLDGWFNPIPDGNWILAVGRAWGGGIEQTFDTTSAHQYHVGLAGAANPWAGSNTTNLLRLRAPGVDTDFYLTDGGYGTTDMRWQQQSATFNATAAQSTINFECADTYFDGLGYPFIDNVWVTDAEVGGKIIFKDEGTSWHFKNAEFEGYISKSTGLMTQLTSLLPTVKNVITPDAHLTLYINNQTAGWTDQLEVLDTSLINKGTEDGRDFYSLTCTLAPSFHNVASAQIEYRLFDDCLGIKAKVNYLANDTSQYKVGIYEAFDPSDWVSQYYYNYPETSTQQLNLRYSYKQNHYTDTLWRTALYPMAILVSPDRYLLWGKLDLRGHVVVSPNDVYYTSPSFTVYPTGITNGNSYTFDYVYKTFPSPGNTYTEALRWYAQRVYDSDPDFNQGPVRLEHTEPATRTIGQGNAAVMIPDYSLLPTALQPSATALAMEDWMLQHNIVHLWYMKLNDWRESGPPTSGSFIMPYVSMTTTAVDMKAEIQRLQAKGFKVYMYFRQAWWFLKDSEWLAPGDRTSPPYKAWINRKPDGSLVQLWDEYVPWTLSELAVAGEIDFNNDEARTWYITQLKNGVAYYLPDGIAFDFGWTHINAATNAPTYSAADPNSDMFQGWLKVQYEVYKWLQQNYPGKKVLINSPGGAPSQLYCDSDFQEIDTTPAHSTYHAASKAYHTNCIDFVAHTTADEALYKTRLNVIPSVGSSWCAYGPHGSQNTVDSLPYVQTLCTALTGFSEKSNAVTLVTNPRVLTPNYYELVGSVWANSTKLKIAIYNNDTVGRDLNVLVDRAILNSYGQTLNPAPPFDHEVIDANGNLKSPTPAVSFNIEPQYLRITATSLGSKELLIIGNDDITTPTSGTATSPSTTTASPFTVSYSGASDDAGGGGLKNVKLWYKKESGGTWTNSGLTQTGGSGSFSFTPSSGYGTYYFDLVAEDNAGNRSAGASGSGDCSTLYE